MFGRQPAYKLQLRTFSAKILPLRINIYLFIYFFEGGAFRSLYVIAEWDFVMGREIFCAKRSRIFVQIEFEVARERRKKCKV